MSVDTTNLYTNAAYLPFGWFILKQDDANLTTNILRMKQQNIQYAFCNLGSINVDGTYTNAFVRDISQYIRLVKANFPEQKILGWLNSATDILITGVTDWTAVQNLSMNLINQFGLDGIHFDIEPMSADDPNLLSFMTKMKSKITPKILSMATTTENWSEEFIAKISQTVDIVSPMVYDSSTTTIANYQSYVYENSLKWLNAATCKIIPTLPSYAANTWHNPIVENITTCMTGFQKAMNFTKKNFTGFSTWNWYEMIDVDNKVFMDRCITPILDEKKIIFGLAKPLTLTINAKVLAAPQWISINLTGVLGLINAKIRVFFRDRTISYSYPGDRNTSGFNNDGATNADFFSIKLLTTNRKFTSPFTVEIISDSTITYIEGLRLAVV